MRFNPAIFVLIALCILALVALVLTIWWKIFGRTGHPAWMGLLMIVPLANIILLLVLAFGEWPVQKELRELKARVG